VAVSGGDAFMGAEGMVYPHGAMSSDNGGARSGDPMPASLDVGGTPLSPPRRAPADASVAATDTTSAPPAAEPTQAAEPTTAAGKGDVRHDGRSR
jgi:hypothetical protein